MCPCSTIRCRLGPPVMPSETASIRSGTPPLPGSSKSLDTPSITITKSGCGRTKARRFKFSGWRVGVMICASTAATVLIVNIALTVWASTKSGLSNGFATIQDGSCQKTKHLNLWLHLVINVLSTILLAASNYCMQCLSSPTREEVDRAHSRHNWLDIGVPSVRNLRSIARNRILLWWLLAFSGIPLHLLYNSAVFATLSSQEYSAYLASDELISGIGINWTATNPLSGLIPADIYQNTSHWQNLTNEECMQAYGQSFVSARSDVLAVTSNLNASDPLRIVGTNISIGDAIHNLGQPYWWLCSAYVNLTGPDGWGCDLNGLSRYSSNWDLSEYRPEDWEYGSEGSLLPVQYCLSKTIDEHCRLQLSLIIMCVVMFCNLIKALCMCLVLRLPKSPPLVTIGDAIESFLQDRDLTTENMCSADKYTFAAKNWDDSTRTYLKKPHKWFSSASWRRWLTCNILCILTLIVAGALLDTGLRNTALASRNISYLWNLGFGTVTSESMVAWNMPGSGGLLLIVLVANSPQAILSFLFLTYNGLYTCMLMANEWSNYAYERKSLRVSNPVGDQRSTYRLQLPYKYGIPLTVLSGTLHWLVSQSLFLARAATFNSDGEENTRESISTVGYSCIAIITVIVLGVIVVALGILNGFRRYRPVMPLVGSCSAAISAACHRPREDIDAATLPVLWGAVSGQEECAVGHCCFTSFEASPPVEGKAYAGQHPETRLMAAALEHDKDGG